MQEEDITCIKWIHFFILYAVSRLQSISVMSLGLVVFFGDNLPRIKDRAYVINLDDKESKEHIGFYYLFIKIRLCTLIILELNIFYKKY